MKMAPAWFRIKFNLKHSKWQRLCFTCKHLSSLNHAQFCYNVSQFFCKCFIVKHLWKVLKMCYTFLKMFKKIFFIKNHCMKVNV